VCAGGAMAVRLGFERWKIARLWCKHVIAFYLQKLTTNCTHKTFLILKKHSLAVGKKRKKKKASTPANERRIV
jgi:hypothetical protein